MAHTWPQPAPADAAAEPPALVPPRISPEAPAVQPDPESAALQPLVLRTCLALQAMARSLGALESVFQHMASLESQADAHESLLQDTEKTVAHAIALLRREGPPLLHRAQALRLRLRLHGYAAGGTAGAALRTLHADLDGLAGFGPERPARIVARWAPHVRRAQSNTLIMLSEFDRHARQIAEQLKGYPIEGATVLPFEAPKPG